MTTYLGYVQGGKCKDTNAEPKERKDNKGRVRYHYPQTFKQFWVIEELRKMGIKAWCGRKIEFYRTGKNRYAEAHESPFLPNYLFIEMSAAQFFSATDVQFLAPTFQMVPSREVIGGDGRMGLDGFKSLIEAQYEAAERIDANSKAAIAEYTKGELITATGPFADMEIWFNRIVQQGHDAWPRIEGLVQMMGGKVPVQFDPLDVRAAR
mgnify:CR=1 FL=1